MDFDGRKCEVLRGASSASLVREIRTLHRSITIAMILLQRVFTRKLMEARTFVVDRSNSPSLHRDTFMLGEKRKEKDKKKEIISRNTTKSMYNIKTPVLPLSPSADDKLSRSVYVPSSSSRVTLLVERREYFFFSPHDPTTKRNATYTCI